MLPRAGELAAINDEIFVADRPPVEETLEDFPCSRGVSGLRPKAPLSRHSPFSRSRISKMANPKAPRICENVTQKN
jgi:hypothetical protein